VINRLITLISIKKAVKLDEKNINLFEYKLRNKVIDKGFAILAIVGPPGSGKTTISNKIINDGFLTFKNEEIMVIDDLIGPESIKYKKRDLKRPENICKRKLLIISDFRAAVYLKRLDFIILLKMDEDKRLENLKKRESRKYKLYKKWYFQIPPIPLRFIKKDLYLVDNIASVV